MIFVNHLEIVAGDTGLKGLIVPKNSSPLSLCRCSVLLRYTLRQDIGHNNGLSLYSDMNNFPGRVADFLFFL